MKYLLIGIALVVNIFSCSKEAPNTFKEDILLSLPAAPIGLDDLAIGDEFNYILFKAESYQDPNNTNFEYTGDTLNVEVCGFRDGKFVVSESFTSGSSIFNSTQDYYFGEQDSVYTNYWHIRNDSLIIEQKDDPEFLSHLLKWNLMSLNLQEFTENEVDMNGWKIDHPFWESNFESHVIDGVIGGNSYPYLNVLTLNAAMAGDGDGFTIIYHRDNGVVSSSSYSAWTGQGQGWELL